MFRPILNCRACGADCLTPVFNLGVQPLANDFCLPGEYQAGYAPLKVLFCNNCTLAQLSVVVDPDILYSHYRYTTSRSQTMADHFADLCADIVIEGGKGSVIEIGSNDGHFLTALHQHGFGPVVGIDPATNLCDTAKANDLNVINKVWGVTAAEESKKFIEQADVIVARHVFCHVDYWTDFIAALDLVSHKDTLVCIEVPYVADLLNRVELDTLYHEHLSYLSLRAVEYLLRDSKWHMSRVTRYPIHGGSILIQLRRNECSRLPDGSVQAFLSSEGDHTTGASAWAKFERIAWERIFTLAETVQELTKTGKTVAGFGASAKSTVWINACKIADRVSFISDTTPEKIGRLSPGSEIPIMSEVEFMEGKRTADYAILFAWNFRGEALQKLERYMQSGGKVIIPVPELEIIPQ